MLKSENGEGKFPLTSDTRDVLPSLLPVRTSHIGFLNCKIKILLNAKA